MDDLEKELTGAWIKYENGSIYGLCGQVTFKGFVDGDTINICIINKPDDLVTE